MCFRPGLGSGGRESASETRSANGSAGLAIGAADLFFREVGGVSSLLGPSEEMGLSVGAESEPLPEALRARRDGGLLAAPLDLVWRAIGHIQCVCVSVSIIHGLYIVWLCECVLYNAVLVYTHLPCGEEHGEEYRNH